MASLPLPAVVGMASRGAWLPTVPDAFRHVYGAAAPHRHDQIARLQTKPVTPNHNGLKIWIGLKPAEPCDLNANALCQRLEVPLQRQAADRTAAHQKYVGSSSRLEVFVQFYVIASR